MHDDVASYRMIGMMSTTQRTRPSQRELLLVIWRETMAVELLQRR